MSKKILIIEEDKDIVDLLKYYLIKESYLTKKTGDSVSSLKKESHRVLLY